MSEEVKNFPDNAKNLALESSLDKVKRTVNTDSYPMSIGEIISMYEKGEIILHPEYQRYFRWTAEQKSKLIESVLIGLPLPSFFVAQDGNGNWEVVDGMQRLSTIFEFIRVLKDNFTHSGFDKLTDDLFYLKDFKDKTWDDFSRRIQLDFKRTKIQLTILQRAENEDAKFELFQRLNSGGTTISGQELRNAILANTNPAMLEWLKKLAKNENFVHVVGLPKSDILTCYDMELVLRFIILLSPEADNLKNFNSLDVFLTHAMRELIKNGDFEFNKWEEIFKTTFNKIKDVGGENVLKKSSRGSGKFSIAAFEAIALGIAQNITKLPDDRTLKAKINFIIKDQHYLDYSGSGKTSTSRIPRLLELGKNYFSNEN